MVLQESGEPAKTPVRHPKALNEGRSRNMQAIRRSDTKPEIRLRALLHSRGLRFRKDLRIDLDSVRVRPDIAFTRKRVAIFVDGCFWHLCPDHGRQPKINDWYWGPKLQRTIERDKTANQALEAADWIVVRVWEHEPVDEAADRIASVLRER
ncbi:very short patch repair endonuclease [Actinoplanes hulinensis]|uniref:Very short patch repair endonuclease n=1 Tax=Actinoplanes hulinensis TaxID=1144547 RepID=A0ABS7BDG9_9ACTN|nr:very short patch repair endonuclease [Actinoplanes hulinensis]MBW6438293.1 very short patch repair endonuclease [Actinoplanes hulinensis]